MVSCFIVEFKVEIHGSEADDASYNHVDDACYHSFGDARRCLVYSYELVGCDVRTCHNSTFYR